MKLKLVLVKKSSDPNLAMTELQMHVQVFLNFYRVKHATKVQIEKLKENRHFIRRKGARMAVVERKNELIVITDMD